MPLLSAVLETHMSSPNEGFLQQLEIFYQASYKISRRSKPVRMFYIERTLEEVMSE